jgi:hypothetical protein
MPPAARGSFRQPLNADGCRPRTDEVADHHRGLWPATVMTVMLANIAVHDRAASGLPSIYETANIPLPVEESSGEMPG